MILELYEHEGAFYGVTHGGGHPSVKCPRCEMELCALGRTCSREEGPVVVLSETDAKRTGLTPRKCVAVLRIFLRDKRIPLARLAIEHSYWAKSNPFRNVYTDGLYRPGAIAWIPQSLKALRKEWCGVIANAIKVESGYAQGVLTRLVAGEMSAMEADLLEVEDEAAADAQG